MATITTNNSSGPSSATHAVLEIGLTVCVAGADLCRRGLYFTSVSLRGGGVSMMRVVSCP